MKYHALYRKYRPSSLDDVVGQKNIIKVIKNSLIYNKISHAYIFSGPRGTGKTTMAKILALNVNCLHSSGGLACGKCKNCLSILEHSTSDIIEIDAASNNGVDEIREIRNNVSLVPSELLYKVYIIDEVHMLSTGAFNALLKTLEEPPEHVIFILATTDLHKVPSTIISRCQCFDFKRISEDEIYNRLVYIAEQEKIDIDLTVLKSIASLSDGGMRDAIGMLDKISSYSDERIELSDFEELNGIVSKEKKVEFLHNIECGDVLLIINFIDNIYNLGKDLVIFSQDLLYLCRDFIILYYTKQMTEFKVDFLLNFVDYFSDLASYVKISNNTRIAFEIKILSFVEKNSAKTFLKPDANSNINKIQNVTNFNMNNFDDKQSNDESNIINLDLKNSNIIINNCFAKANKTYLNNMKNNWFEFSNYALDSEYGAVACYINDAIVRVVSECEIIITYDYESMVVRGYKVIDKIKSLFKKIFNKDYKIAIITTSRWNELKEKYIDDINNGITYEYCQIPIESDKINMDFSSKADRKVSSTDIAVQLFGNDVVDQN